MMDRCWHRGDFFRTEARVRMFSGCYTALVTPFQDQAPDLAAFAALIEWQIAAGIDGIVPCGTTGEAATLTEAEHIALIACAVATARGRVPVLAGAGGADTRKVIGLLKEAKRLGAHGGLVVTPYYNRPGQAGLRAHYLAAADAVELPLLLYNVPSRTGIDMTVDTIAALSTHPNIVGVKEATGDLGRVAFLRAQCGAEFRLVSGDDSSALGFIAHGGDGVISVTSNVAPAEMAAMCGRAAAGDFAAARAVNQRLAPLHRALLSDASPAPAKFALASLGRMSGELRLPLVAAHERARADISAALHLLQGGGAEPA